MSDVRYLVDGMLSGTGIRDVVNGGYVKPQELNLSIGLQEMINQWISKYEDAHYDQYHSRKIVDELDKIGIEIANKIESERRAGDIGYFSNGLMIRLNIY